MSQFFIRISVTAAVLSLCLPVLAQTAAVSAGSTRPGAPGPAAAGGPPLPPPHAFKECEAKTEGTKLEMITPRGDKVLAICVKYTNGVLFARPMSGGKPQQAPRPEGEAVSKAANKAASQTASR